MARLPAWPEERVERLRKLKRQGLTRPELAEALGVSLCAINGKLWRLGLGGKPGEMFIEPRAGAPTGNL